ncbi:MAG: MBL fold metallo-hydrolase [Halanaerobiaceae bacterium]
MKIDTIEVGTNMTNCYIVSKNRQAVIIDPGDDAEKILLSISKNELNVTDIILTHGHFDHIGAVDFLRNRLDIPVSIHRGDSEFLTNSQKNLSFFLGDEIVTGEADKYLEEDSKVQGFIVIETPGHTPGGISLYDKNNSILISGDTIFSNGYGRTDLPGADSSLLVESIRSLMNLPDDVIVYPGHGPKTTIIKFREFFSRINIEI